MDHITDDPNNNKEEGKAHEVAQRLRHEECRELLKKPGHKSLHISHGVKHPPI